MANPLRAARLAQKARLAAKGSSTRPPAPKTISNTGPVAPKPAPPPGPASVAPPYHTDQPLSAVDADKLSFARMANALLPFFSSQDQQAVATFLNTQDPKGLFKNYLGTLNTPNAQTVDESGKAFASSARASEALAKLDAMRTSAGLTEEQLGSGYKFLKQAIGILKNLGVNTAAGEQGMTRAEYENLQAQLESLNSQANSDQSLAPYAELATKFINPTLIGTLFPTSSSGGHTIYGQTNKKLFT